MFKKLCLFLIGFFLLSNTAYANDTPIVSKEVKPIIPCQISGNWAARACILVDVKFEASAPRPSVVFDRKLAKPIIGKSDKLAIIYRYRAVDTNFNKDAVVLIWTTMNRFLAEFPVSVTRDVTVYSISDDGGKSWSGIRTSNRNVSMMMSF